MRQICLALKRIVEDVEDVSLVYPLHLNPKVRETVIPILSGVERIFLTEPLDVLDMHNLMARVYMVVTDSGGLQEEAPALGKPVLVLRKETDVRKPSKPVPLCWLVWKKKESIGRLRNCWFAKLLMRRWQERSILMVTVMPVRGLQIFCRE